MRSFFNSIIAIGALAIVMVGLNQISDAAPLSAEDAAAPAAQAAGSPLAEVKSTIDALVLAVAKFPGEEKLGARRDALREIITPKFDFEEMAKRSLGSYWKEVSVAEQREFVTVFSDLLAKTYLARIENIRAETVKIESEKINLPNALVKTTVTHKGDTFPIDYKLINTQSGTWRVYDVVIENIGLVANYRTEFAGIIRKEQFAGLMKRLRDKSVES